MATKVQIKMKNYKKALELISLMEVIYYVRRDLSNNVSYNDFASFFVVLEDEIYDVTRFIAKRVGEKCKERNGNWSINLKDYSKKKVFHEKCVNFIREFTDLILGPTYEFKLIEL